MWHSGHLEEKHSRQNAETADPQGPEAKGHLEGWSGPALAAPGVVWGHHRGLIRDAASLIPAQGFVTEEGEEDAL